MEVTNKSHLKLEAKTALLVKEFNLPESLERVVQDYRCTWTGPSGRSVSGKVYVTQYHVFVWRSSSETSLKLAYSRLEMVVCKGRSQVVLVTRDQQDEHTLSSFTSGGKRDEAYALIHHLMQHPFSVRAAPAPSVRLTPGGDDDGSIDPRIDVESGARAEARAAQAMESGVATLEELARQQEVLQSMHGQLGHMEDDLDRANRHLRGIESVGGSMLNKVTSEPTSSHRQSKLMRGAPVLAAPAPAVPELEAAPDVVEAVVWKHSNDALEEAEATFQAPGMVVHLISEHKEVGRIRYAQLAQLRVRARPLHLDLVHEDGSRLRLCSAALQVVLNELILRSPHAQVVWERNALPMEVGHTWLRQPASALLSASAAVQRGIAIQDRQLDAVEESAKLLQHLALDLGDELDSSTNQIKGVQQHTDAVGKKISTTNERVVRLL